MEIYRKLSFPESGPNRTKSGPHHQNRQKKSNKETVHDFRIFNDLFYIDF